MNDVLLVKQRTRKQSGGRRRKSRLEMNREQQLPESPFAPTEHGDLAWPGLDSFVSWRLFLSVSMPHQVCWPAAVLMARPSTCCDETTRDSSGARLP